MLQQQEPLTVDYITFVASDNVLICTRCSIAVPAKGLDTHLRKAHHVPTKLRRATISRFDSVPAAQYFHDLVLRPDQSTPLAYLLPPAPGFCCPHCPEGKTISWDQMRQYAKTKHNIRAPDCVKDQSRYECYLQSWTKYSPRYWVVTQDNDPSQQEDQEQLQPATQGEYLTRMEDEEEEQRFDGGPSTVALDMELEHDEDTEWLRGCEWPTWFARKPIHLIIAAAALPSARTSEDLSLGLWNGFECVSPAQTERILWKILDASKVVFQRCEITLKQTPRVLRCWLRSWTPSFLPYPFELPQREQTRRRYYAIHERFLSYIFRILALSRHIKEPVGEISGLQLNTAQLAMMNHIWGYLSVVIEQEDCGVLLESSLDGVQESLFQLLVMFWTDLSYDGNMNCSAIMHFSGVLGIYLTELCFRKPYNYTLFISALLWVGRLVILEYALLLRLYNLLKVLWPERTAYAD
jgi:hypothetical protein